MPYEIAIRLSPQNLGAFTAAFPHHLAYELFAVIRAAYLAKSYHQGRDEIDNEEWQPLALRTVVKKLMALYRRQTATRLRKTRRGAKMRGHEEDVRAKYRQRAFGTDESVAEFIVRTMSWHTLPKRRRFLVGQVGYIWRKYYRKALARHGNRSIAVKVAWKSLVTLADKILRHGTPYQQKRMGPLMRWYGTYLIWSGVRRGDENALEAARRHVRIMIDSGALINSLSPGMVINGEYVPTSTNRREAPGGIKEGQVFRMEREQSGRIASVEIGVRVSDLTGEPYAAYHHHGIGRPLRRLWPGNISKLVYVAARSAAEKAGGALYPIALEP